MFRELIRRPAWWWFLAAASLLLAAASIVVTYWLHLSPCHLCIFQRFLFLVLALVAAVVARTWARRLPISLASALLFSAIAVLGAGVAAYQSLLQWQPANLSCSGATLGPIEQFVEWLASWAPLLFLPTGFCTDPGLVILGLTLANWAFLAYTAFLIAALWAIWARSAHGRALRPHHANPRTPKRRGAADDSAF